MKKKMTITFSDKMAETLSYLSTVYKKPQNDILENAFWEWWQKQDDGLKDSIKNMIELSSKVRKSAKTTE